MTHCTPDDASTAALLLTCLARCAIRRPGLRRVFACQTATMRYHTWHAASSWGYMTHCTPDDASTVALTCLARRAIRRAGLRIFACQTATKRGTLRRHGVTGINEMGQETSTLILISLSLLLTLPHLLCNPAPQNCVKHIILFKTAAFCSPASHAVQLTEPASAEYLPIRQPLSVTTLGMQRPYVHMKPCA